MIRRAGMAQRISVFVPVFNEEKILESRVRIIEHAIKKLSIDYEIFIVNDASTDKTRIIAEEMARAGNKIRALACEIGPTRRENLAQSFKKASGGVVIFLDIDVIASLRALPDLLEGINSGYDIVLGSRYLPGSRIKRKPWRLVVSFLSNWFLRLVLGTGMRDHLCGFKAFKREVVLRLVNEMGYDETLKRGIFWDTELLARAKNHGYKIKEIPVWWKERRESRLYFRREIRALLYILKFARESYFLR